MSTPVKLTALVAMLTAAPAGLAQRDRDSEPVDRCESATCFNQLQIRDFEVIGKTTMIVFVGGLRCPFLIELTGTFCDITFLPPQSVVFRPGRMARARTAPIIGGGTVSPDGGGPVEQTRVCASDIDMGLLATPFSSAVAAEDTGNSGLSCNIMSVRSLTDDERLQIYVDNQISAPPPPFGTGRVEAPEDPEEPEARPAEEELDRRERRRLRRERERQEDADD